METTYSLAQEQYWQLFSRYGATLTAMWRAEHAHEEEQSLETSVALLEAQQEHAAAEAAMDAFRKEHDGESFLVFRPDDIDRAIDNTIEPLVPEWGSYL